MKIGKLTILPDRTIKEALRQLDRGAEKILFVVNKEGSLSGTVTDGDIRRHILKGKKLTGSIASCFNRSPKYLEEGFDKDFAKSLMLENKIDVLPIVDRKMALAGYITWEQLFGEGLSVEREKIDVPVVIMAGGKGTRLDPFTKILPKPLIPIGEKPIIEIIMDRFSEAGVSDFYLTVNYKGEMIQSYFYDTKTTYNIHFQWEKEFLGTAGSLSLLPKKLGNTFIISNCDIIVKADYADLVSFHIKNGYCLTLVGSIQHYKIPYGIIEIGRGGELKSITEKPEYDFLVNTGLYVVNKKALKYIPRGRKFHMTDLINRLIEKKEPVGVYPVSEKSYIDIGQWEEYREGLKQLLG